MIAHETAKEWRLDFIDILSKNNNLLEPQKKMMNTIISLINQALYLLKQNSENSQEHTLLHSEKHDVKLSIDKSLGDLIFSTLQSSFPGHSIISEENGILQGTKNYTWIIDPLDGSVNYFFGLPFYGISIACFNKELKLSNGHYNFNSLLEQPFVGAVFIPFENKLYWAIKGHGAFCNSKPLECPQNKEIQEVILSMNFSGRKNNMDKMTSILSKLVKQVKKIRSHGATAVDLAYIASGKIGALIQRGIKIWDFAAAYMIISEAGGNISVREHENNSWDVIASFPNLYNYLLESAGLF